MRRAQAAEAARRAEEQRRREAELEQQRINAENKRRMEEIAKQAKFIDDRDAAVGTLRGSVGVTSGGPAGSVLRGSTGTGATSTGPVLRGSGMDTGLRELKPDTAHTPNLDPMVVDARNVPTGLPRTVAAEIPDTPAGNRVRKGFEAIMDHDWNVAHAWFQDALNHDPGNAGIRRLVGLAEYTLQRGKHPHPPALPGKAVADTGAQDAARMATLDRQIDDKMDEDLQRAFDDFNRNYLPKHPELAKPEKRSAPLPPPAEQQANWQTFFDALFVQPSTKPRRPGSGSAVRD